jgi:SAM-dependent methyltransferase
MSDSSKQFGPIRADYEFFQTHSTECDADIRAYLPHLAAAAAGTGPIRVLDFGCGDGQFSSRLYPRSPLPPARLELSLVEPDDDYRESAIQRLRPFTSRPPRAWPALPTDLVACFDLVLSNHVLYYVTDLDGTLASILRSLASGGCFLTAMAGQRNGLIQFWNRCFELIGMPVPFHTSEALEALLARRSERYSKADVRYEMSFPDREENRLSIVRFLLGGYFPRVPRQAMLDLFDPYVESSEVKMHLVHDQFAVRRGE